MFENPLSILNPLHAQVAEHDPRAVVALVCSLDNKCTLCPLLVLNPATLQWAEAGASGNGD